MGDVDTRVHIYTVMALGRTRMASPMFGHDYPWYSFYIRLSGSLDQCGHEGVKGNLHPSDTGD